MYTLRDKGDREPVKPAELAKTLPAAGPDRSGVRNILKELEQPELSPEQRDLAEVEALLRREQDLSGRGFTAENLRLLGAQQMIQYFGLTKVTAALQQLAKTQDIKWHSLVGLLEPDQKKRQAFYGKMVALAREYWSDDARRKNPQLVQSVELHASILQMRDRPVLRFVEAKMPKVLGATITPVEGATRLLAEIDVNGLIAALEAANGDFLSAEKSIDAERDSLSVERKAKAQALMKKVSAAIEEITASELLRVQEKVNPLLERLQASFVDSGYTESDPILIANANATEASIEQLNATTAATIAQKTKDLRAVLERARAVYSHSGVSNLTL